MFTNDTDRGQVGIGTLIVFIAMVLVAAIAAGVLINTAGFLQAQAEATGEESSEQVSDRVQVSSVTGSAVNQTASDVADASNLSLIELTVLRSPGADDIDLTNVIIEVFANGESDTLTFVGSDESDVIPASDDVTAGENSSGTFTTNDGSDFGIQDIQNADDASLSDSSDRASLFFFLDNINDEATLQEGNTVTISITTASGGTAFVEKRAPSTIESGQTYRL